MIRRRRRPGSPAPLLTEEARAIPMGGFEHARRLGLPYVDAVRDRMTETFGLEALSRAGHAARPRAISRPRWDPRRPGPGVHANGVFLPHSPDVIHCLLGARAEQEARHDTQIGVELLALSLLSLTTGLVPPILAALGTPAATLRAAVADACRATGEPPQR
jgi:hypothetical protein